MTSTLQLFVQTKADTLDRFRDECEGGILQFSLLCHKTRLEYDDPHVEQNFTETRSNSLPRIKCMKCIQWKCMFSSTHLRRQQPWRTERFDKFVDNRKLCAQSNNMAAPENFDRHSVWISGRSRRETWQIQNVCGQAPVGKNTEHL